jgi:hypothetical protein
VATRGKVAGRSRPATRKQKRTGHAAQPANKLKPARLTAESAKQQCEPCRLSGVTMLISNMLRKDPRLQRCLVSDQAHVTPGAFGPHVQKIQLALMALDNARIEFSELRSKTYGVSTTAAVLAYKRKRRIINPAYQTQADNIVGKMTIASLDKELVALDRRPVHTAFCGHGVSLGPSALKSPPVFEASLVGGPHATRKHYFKNFRLLFQITSLADTIGGFNMLDALWMRAKVLMAPYRLDFADGRPVKGHVLPYDQNVDVNFTSEQFVMHALSLKADAAPADTLRVIFCPFADTNPYFGITCGGPAADGQEAVPKFVLINAWLHHKDSGTLLHEMIHAAKPEKSDSTEHDEGNPRSVFSTASDGRDQLPDKYAERLSRAYFG